MIRRTALAAAMLAAAAGAAQAQSSVTMFGLVDVTLGRYRGEGNGSQTLLSSDGYQSSRFGIRGTEDLGGGLKAGFWLEAAFNPDNGTGGTTNTNNLSSGAGATCSTTPALPAGTTCSVAPNGTQGLTFGRRSTVSLQGGWGELRLGRDYVPGFANLSSYNPFGTNGVGSSGFLFYPVQGAARQTHVRASNSIGYFTPKFGGFTGQLMYAVGENASNAGAAKDDGQVWGLRAAYDGGPWDVAYGYTKTKISAVGDFRQMNVGASWDFGVAKPMLLWNENKVGATRTRSWLLGVTAPVGPGVIRAAYARVSTRLVANDAHQFTLGYVYNLSKRTALYTSVSRITNSGGTNYNVGRATTVVGGSSDGFELGVRHSF